MSKVQDKFFEKKKPWSEIKDDILGEYLLPYMSKILKTNKPIHYVDCFAGKGMFNDGKAGSPIIALNAIEIALRRTTAKYPDLRTYFIERDYGQDLRKNLTGRSYTQIINGSYEQNIDSLLRTFGNDNVFLYLDPYGIKYLDMYRFFDLKNSDFSSIECLINFNSFGFFRVACSILKVNYLEGDSDDVYDYDLYYYFKKSATEKLLNDIAGGDYWKDIIFNYKDGLISGPEAENLISEKYRQILHGSYPYVLDLPIRLKENQITKYRLIHLTTHEKGCLLMAGTILKQQEQLTLLQRKGQMALFKDCFEQGKNEPAKSKMLLLDQIHDLDEKERIDVVFAKFYTKNGLHCHPKTLRTFISELEENHQIRVIWEPSETIPGKPKTNLTESNGSKVWLYRN